MATWDEARLAALCGLDRSLSDRALARAARDQRSAVTWVWWRLAHDGGAARHATLAEVARDLAVREAVAAARLSRVVDTLGSAGIPSVLFKGAALSYGPFPDTWMRPRLDDDLLVRSGDFARAGRLLAELGYVARAQNPGPERLGQAHFTSVFEAGDTHHLDLHWRPLVPAAFAGVPGAEELLARSQPIADLGRYARAPARSDALLLGCAHRVAHHGGDDDPQWVIDTHVLAAGFDDERWGAFVVAARRAGVARVCAAELARAKQALETRVPAGVLAELQRAGEEPSARHRTAHGRLRRWVLEMQQHPGGAWPAFRARAFPPTDYMRERYRVPAPLLPAAYAWRAVVGGGRWLAEAAGRRRHG